MSEVLTLKGKFVCGAERGKRDTTQNCSCSIRFSSTFHVLSRIAFLTGGIAAGLLMPALIPGIQFINYLRDPKVSVSVYCIRALNDFNAVILI